MTEGLGRTGRKRRKASTIASVHSACLNTNANTERKTKTTDLSISSPRSLLKFYKEFLLILLCTSGNVLAKHVYKYVTVVIVTG